MFVFFQQIVKLEIGLVIICNLSSTTHTVISNARNCVLIVHFSLSISSFSTYSPHHCLLQYAESIPHLRESLAINSLQVTLWFHLGYAALHEEDWSLCATAYQRYCSLDPEVFLSCEPSDSYWFC